jgi:hypothetical protein
MGADAVNPLTTSAFDLPGRLIAKADPALIAGDEQHFAAIAESLEQSIAELSGRLDDERKAPGGIGQEAMDRENPPTEGMTVETHWPMPTGSPASSAIPRSGRRPASCR